MKLEEGATDSNEQFQKAFRNYFLSRVKVPRWHNDFVYGRVMVEDELRSGRATSMRRSINVHRADLSFVKIDV
jgi:hypothetical protein